MWCRTRWRKASVEHLGEGGAVAAGAAGRLGEHPVAAGRGEGVDLELGVLVGGGDAGIAEQVAHAAERRRTLSRRWLGDVDFGHEFWTPLGALATGHQGTRLPRRRRGGGLQLIESAQHRWRAVNAPHPVFLVRAGARFENGKLVERPDESGGDQQAA
jgi:hypothetical protein